jgi:hypothetical protein
MRPGWLVLGLIASTWLVILVVLYPRLAFTRALAQSSEVTSGVIVAINRSDHNRAHYRYGVAGNDHEGSEVGRSCCVGRSVNVYYSPTDPSKSMLREPKRAYRDDRAGLIEMCAFIALAIVAVHCWVRR